jgi:hypothetical protein
MRLKTHQVYASTLFPLYWMIADLGILSSVVQEGSRYHKFPDPQWTAQEINGAAMEPSKANWIDTEQGWCFV